VTFRGAADAGCGYARGFRILKHANLIRGCLPCLNSMRDGSLVHFSLNGSVLSLCTRCARTSAPATD
jgi:hypothetical protein